MTEPRPWTWSWLIATTLAKGVLSMVICLGLWGSLPALIGWQPTTVSSGSMLPRLHVGDVAVARPVGAAPPPLGSVLLFDDPDHPDRLRLHRFVRVGEDGRPVTRGDANTADDSSPIDLSAVHGIGTLRVPWVGLPVVWLRQGDWLPLAVALLGILGLAALAAQARRFGFPDSPDDHDDQDGESDPGTAPDGSAGDAEPSRLEALLNPRSPGAWFAVPALGVALLLGGLQAVPAGAVFHGTTTAKGSVAAAQYFSCSGAVSTAAPWLWYRLDEGPTATTAADSSGNNRPGVFSSTGRTPQVSRACPSDTGYAMTFDGASGSLSSPLITTALPQVFTLSVWFRTTTTTGGKLVGFGNAATGVSSSYDRHLYMTNAGNVVFGVYPSGVKTVATPLTYNDGAWHQAVATLSSAGMRLYVDGALIGSDATATSGEPSTSGYLRVGYDNLDGWPNAPTSRYFGGTLDEVAVYTSALTATQISDQFAASGRVSCSDAVRAGSPSLWYRLDEAPTATTAVDSSGGNRPGTFSSAGRTAQAPRACPNDTGYAMTFDGTSGYLASPLISPLPQTFTVSIWFKTATAAGGKLLGFGNSPTGVSGTYDRHLYMTNAGNIVFGVYPGAVRTLTTPAAYNNDSWHQAVGTLSSAGMRLYVDGALIGTDTTVTGAEGAASGYLKVAFDNLDNWPSAPTSRYFNGTLDDAVVYPTALSDGQVLALYNARL